MEHLGGFITWLFIFFIMVMIRRGPRAYRALIME